MRRKEQEEERRKEAKEGGEGRNENEKKQKENEKIFYVTRNPKINQRHNPLSSSLLPTPATILSLQVP